MEVPDMAFNMSTSDPNFRFGPKNVPHRAFLLAGGNQKPDVLPPRCPPLRGQSEREPANRDVKLPNESLKNAMFDMPYVSTKGDGPNGHKIEGFLYRYKKGEEVRIVCVCHGDFLTPAEFIKHGGGGDVEHPLKHIVVNPFPLL